jgi:antirestriction protein
MLQQGMQGSLSVFANGGEVNDPFVMGLMEKYKHRMQKPSQYKLGGAVSENEPSIYVADLLAYTEGRLEGFWLDLSDYDSGAEVMERIQQFLDAQSKKTGELHEEYAIHDFENFPSELYSEYMTEDDFDKIISAYKVQNELDIPYNIILQVQREYGADYEQIKNGFFTKTTGDNEDKALGMAYVEIVGFNNIKNKDYYFDFTEYGSAIRSDVTNDEDEEESYAELSDYDLGEHYIELGGGIDNVSNKMLEDYFDYESFGNDLSIDDFESYRDGSDVYWFSKRLENGGKLRGDDDDDDQKEYSKAKKKVDAMSDDDVFEQIEDIYYYEMQDSDTSPEDLRNDIDGARKALIEFYAEDEDEDEEEDDDISVQPFNDGGMTKKTGYDIYHNTLAATLDEINDYARRNGYTLGEFSREVGHISYGTTWRAYAPCMDDSGKQVNTIQVQIYRMDSGKYELNAYFDKKRKKKDDSEYLFDGEPLPFADGGEITDQERKNSRKNTPKLF